MPTDAMLYMPLPTTDGAFAAAALWYRQESMLANCSKHIAHMLNVRATECAVPWSSNRSKTSQALLFDTASELFDYTTWVWLGSLDIKVLPMGLSQHFCIVHAFVRKLQHTDG